MRIDAWLALMAGAAGGMPGSGGLRISGVVAYRISGAQNLVVVAFKLTDDSYRPASAARRPVRALAAPPMT